MLTHGPAGGLPGQPLPGLGGLRLQAAGEVRVDGAWSAPAYRTTGHTLLQVLEGRGAVHSGRLWWDLIPGQLYAIPGHQVLRRRTTGMRHRWCNFTGEALAWDLQVGQLRRVLAFPMDKHQPWAEALAASARAGALGSPLLAAQLEGVLLQVFAALLAAAGAAARPLAADDAVTRALAWLDRHYLHQPTLGEVAAAAGRSATHLQERFTAVVGCSPTAYARLRRLQDAQYLLQGSSLSVQEVARRCGYADPLHFSRVVRRHCGCSPRRLRALVQG